MQPVRPDVDPGRPQEALPELLAYLEARPDDVEAWVLAADTLAALRAWTPALDAVRTALSHVPDHPGAHAAHARILQARGLSAEAEVVLARAARAVGAPTLYSELGWLRLRRADHEGARAAFQAALTSAPGLVSALSGLALNAVRAGHPERAVSGLEKLVKREPLPALVYPWARGLVLLGQGGRAIARLRRALRGAMPVRDRRDLLHALGDALDQCGEHAAAFEAFSKANALVPGTFDGPRHRAAVHVLAEHFPRPDLVQPSPRRGRALLVVGVPRSGTSLVESMLSQHPDVSAAGELEAWRLLALEAGERSGSEPWYRHPERIDQALLDRLAASYERELALVDADASRVVDKMPNNVLHLGLAAWAVPDLVVVHCVRDPVDTAWSCYRTELGPGLLFAASLDGLAWWIRAERELMAHWEASLDVPVVTVKYEELVKDPEATLRPVIEACGLDWDPAVARHEGTERAVATASHAQVRQPLYGSSVGRSRAYHAFMEPFFRAWEASAKRRAA